MVDQYRRIFLLSHMRAFTSLAGHILGSHPQINGYYEMHISYSGAQSLQRQLELYREHDALKVNSRYLFDKLLHNDYLLQPERLDLTSTKILLALRNPESTIKSIVNLFAQKQTDDLYASPLEAARYYMDRINQLAAFCQGSKGSYYYFDAEMLQSAPDVLLPALSLWLDLDSPLSGQYSVFSQTGRDRKGDSSDSIHSGEISKTKSDYTSVIIPDEPLILARHVYQDCRQTIMDGAIASVVIPAKAGMTTILPSLSLIHF